MVFFDNFEEFLSRAKKMIISHPTKTRYSMKIRHGEEKVYLKVTNDIQTLTYKTQNQTDMKKIEMLNSLFLRLMSVDVLDADAMDKEEASLELEHSEAGTGAALPQYIKQKSSKRRKKNKN